MGVLSRHKLVMSCTVWDGNGPVAHTCIKVVCAEIQDYCCKSKYIQKDWMSSFYLFLFFMIYLTFYFMCIGVKVSNLLELDFQTVVSCHVRAGN